VHVTRILGVGGPEDDRRYHVTRNFCGRPEIKERYINSEDDLPENWFESSKPQDDFDRQEIEESLLGAAVLNVE
ncbi:6260_t:CDS:2, partial [Gigaspora margarita]